MKKSRGETLFQVIALSFMLLIVLAIVLPLMHIVSVSLSDKRAVTTLSVGIFPKGLDFRAYGEILTKRVFLRSLANTVGVTAVATTLSLAVNVCAAYAFSKNFYAKKLITYLFIITMYFSGGLIPTYLVVTKYLHLYNTYFAFFLPGIANVFYIIVIRSQIEALPASLSEAAIIDGAKEYQVLFHVVAPSILPTMAAIGMFTALATWNMWFPVLLYTNREELWSLQYFLRAVVFDKFMEYMPGSRSAGAITSEADSASPLNFQMAAIVLVALPIVAIYPFVQRYFVKGILVGSVKG
jgi:putative aldouronate transport system permease protein